VDRMNGVVIRGGENIYCAEAEAAPSEHPAIVVPRDGARLAAAGVQRHVAGRLASFKVPAHVVFRCAPLPRAQSGKVLKRDLRSAIPSEPRDG
jgi:long-chain acyl-CoA synthetase